MVYKCDFGLEEQGYISLIHSLNAHSPPPYMYFILLKTKELVMFFFKA